MNQNYRVPRFTVAMAQDKALDCEVSSRRRLGARDAGTHEGAVKAAETRKSHGSTNQSQANVHKEQGQYHLKQAGEAHKKAATAHFEAATAHRTNAANKYRESNRARSLSISAGVDPKAIHSRFSV